MHVSAAARRQIVVQGGEDRVVPDQTVVANRHSALILEFTSGIEKDALAQRMFFPKSA